MKGAKFSSIVRVILCFAGLIFAARGAVAQVASGLELSPPPIK